jgi:hypothetical protein
VQLLPDPPMSEDYEAHGAIAQLGERLVCNQKVTGSIPVGSTSSCRLPWGKRRTRLVTRYLAIRDLS